MNDSEIVDHIAHLLKVHNDHLLMGTGPCGSYTPQLDRQFVRSVMETLGKRD